MIIETERLVLRPFEESDVDPVAAINADAETMRYFEAPLTREQTAAAIVRYQDGLKEDGYGFLAAELVETGETVGIIGMRRYDEATRMAIPGHPKVEVGWRLRRDTWGQGLAPEGASACLAYAWEKLRLEEIVAITVVANQPSRRVMEKIGMTHDPDGDFDHPGVTPGHPVARHVLYRIKNPKLTVN